MPGYIIVDVKTKKLFAVCFIACLVTFVIGILIGVFSRKGRASPNTSDGDGIQRYDAKCKILAAPVSSERVWTRYWKEQMAHDMCVNSEQTCLDLGRPRHYTAFHLRGRSINVDGDLSDIAWNEVPWSDKFTDIRGDSFPKPYLETRFKVRWDDTRLYIGVKLQEADIWATITEPDAKIFQENCIDILMDVDGTLFNYKQIQINALGTVMDQVLYKSPHDGGTKLKDWQASIMHAVKTSGTINMSRDKDNYWSVELSMTFRALSALSARSTDAPTDTEVWFMQFGRAQYKLTPTSNGAYEPKGLPDWWAWQPCGAVNLQLQDRWGLVQFKRDISDVTFSFPKWHVYKALFETLNAVKTYKAVHSKNPSGVVELTIPPYLLTGACVDVPDVTVFRRNGDLDFNITVTSKVFPEMSAIITSDRYVQFTQNTADKTSH